MPQNVTVIVARTAVSYGEPGFLSVSVVGADVASMEKNGEPEV